MDAAAAPTSPAPEQRIDYNALDNSFGGRLIQAGFIVGFYAAGDLTRHVIAARLALAAANLGVVAAFNAFDEEPGNDLTSVARDGGSPAQTWALLGGAGAAAAGVAVASTWAHRAVARSLARRGVNTPWTAMGAVVAAGYLAATQLAQAKR
ncbi:hypothetical protein [Corynebacterium sp.]|uniref:hypothetical protein n=1 Tax=Corynebacterium sp. TaxID=1720 RepID=UPI002A920935|nr:hypothetical protein [Corynebacterium sp.]MDY5784833.1 hypothetical protein [Corynebacterium sp.]